MVDTIMMNPNNYILKYFYVNLSRQVVDVEVDGKIYLTQKYVVDESNLKLQKAAFYFQGPRDIRVRDRTNKCPISTIFHARKLLYALSIIHTLFQTYIFCPKIQL